MTPDQIAASAGDSAWMLVSAALVLLMTPALSLFYGGMSRQKSALNMMMMSFGTMGVVGVVYVLWGWSMSYGDHSFAGIVADPLQFLGLDGALTTPDGLMIAGQHGYPQVIDVAFQLTFAVITVAIISGSLANRVKFFTWLVFAAVWVTLSYFPLAHMVWGGGLLSPAADGLAARMFGTVGEGADAVARIAPIDFAGGTVVHINAGVAGLVLALIIGRSHTFMKEEARPHSLPLVMLGAALLWFGWFGFNAGSAFGANGMAGLAWINTTAATCAAMLGWITVEKLRDGHVTSLGAASGVVAGLVTVTPAAGDVTPVTALLLGVVGGGLAAVGVGLKYRFRFDDSLDVVGVHLVAGVWGTVGVALVATGRGVFTGGGVDGLRLLAVQVVEAGAAAVFCAVVTVVVGLVLRSTLGWRISPDDEQAGIDLAVHAESAYHVEEGPAGSVASGGQGEGATA